MVLVVGVLLGPLAVATAVSAGGKAQAQLVAAVESTIEETTLTESSEPVESTELEVVTSEPGRTREKPVVESTEDSSMKSARGRRGDVLHRSEQYDRADGGYGAF